MLRADLRSDTLTRPTQGMRAAMTEADVGDDVYGEDPTVLTLEQRVADLLGHEGGLFTPSGTMAGQLAVRHHVAAGQELIADEMSHVLRAEMGAAATLWGITSRSWAAPHGLLDPSGPLELMAPAAGPYLVSTACVVLENTHNFGGGTVQPLDAMQDVAAAAKERGVAVHLDGARLWNAHVATGVPLRDYGACADTVSVCLSKGLGAPVGSVLVGSADVVGQARVWRKRLGGGMRQVGLMAAAGAYALEHHLTRLAEDHERAAQVARAVHEARPEVIDPGRVRTNILVLDVGVAGWGAADFVAAAGGQGVQGFATDARHVRYVWHLDVSTAQTDHAAAVLTELVGQGRA